MRESAEQFCFEEVKVQRGDITICQVQGAPCEEIEMQKSEAGREAGSEREGRGGTLRSTLEREVRQGPNLESF